MTTQDTTEGIDGTDDDFAPVKYGFIDTRPEPLGPVPPTPYSRIEWRPTTKANRVQDGMGQAGYICYIGARTARELMDKWVGAENWSVQFREGTLTGQPILWCDISVRLSNGEWLTRSDIGVPGRGDDANTTLKGLVSDATKRAAAAWGVGRDVYLYPIVWATVKVVDHNGKQRVYAHPRAQEEINEAVKRAGFDIEGESSRTSDWHDDASSDTTEQSADWTQSVKNYCWEHTGRDSEAGLAVFESVARRMGLTVFDSEEAAAAAMEVADEYLAEWTLNKAASDSGAEASRTVAADERPF